MVLNIQFIKKKISLDETMIETEKQMKTMNKDDPLLKKVFEEYKKFKKDKEDHEHNSHSCNEEEVDNLIKIFKNLFNKVDQN